MSNKTSDKNVANEERLNNFIEAYKQTKEQSFIVDSINKDFFFEFVDCLLAELEQKDKRIQELEADLYSSDEIIADLTDSIPKQVVTDKMEELNKEIKSCDEIDAIFKIKQQQILQELLEGERK